MIRTLADIPARLIATGRRYRYAVICGSDAGTLQAALRAVSAGFAEIQFFGHTDAVAAALAAAGPLPEGSVSLIPAADDADAARQAVSAVSHGRADVLMKGLIGTATMLRAVLDKQEGLLPSGGTLTHQAVAEWADYGKLLLCCDVAVIPFPTPQQRRVQVALAARTCRAMGIDTPRIALIHCSETASDKFPYTTDYAAIIAEAQRGDYGPCLVDGPLDLRTAIDAEALRTKGIESPLEGRADALIFPDIEAGNVFYKAVTGMMHLPNACMMAGTTHPVVLPSRGDDADTKYNSMAMAALTLNRHA